MIDEKYEIGIIRDKSYLKSLGIKKPILVVEKGNTIIKVASFKNDEMVDLFMKAINLIYTER